MSACYRRTEGCDLAGGHDKTECGPVQAAAGRVQAFLDVWDSQPGKTDMVYGTTNRQGRMELLLTGDLRLLLAAIQ